MEFVTILIVLGLVQLWGSGAPVQRDNWFVEWSDTVAGVLGAGVWRLLVIVAMPLVLVLLLQDWFEGALLGLLSLILFAVVLLYSLGRGDYNEAIQHYLSAWVNGNMESAYERALAIGDFQQSDAIADHQSLHSHVRRALTYEGYQRWFAVVFWFLLLGPCGALGYRLSYLCARNDRLGPEDRQLALRFVHYLDWVPARLLGLSFFLTGNFVSGASHCGPQMLDNMPVPELLDECGRATISSEAEEPVQPEELERFIEYGRNEIRAVQSLQSRSVICWLIIIAVLAVVGA